MLTNFVCETLTLLNYLDNLSWTYNSSCAQQTIKCSCVERSELFRSQWDAMHAVPHANVGPIETLRARCTPR